MEVDVKELIERFKDYKDRVQEDLDSDDDFLLAVVLAVLEEVEELDKEKQKLIINLNVARGIARKRGQAIEIIKDFVTIEKIDGYEGDFITQDYSSSRRLSKEKANLLKEVFGYD